MINKITSEIIAAYSECHRKAFLLKQTSQNVDPSAYIEFMESELEKSRKLYFRGLKEGDYAKNIEVNDLIAYVDSICKDEKSKENGALIPILVIGTNKYSKVHKLQLAFAGFVLNLQHFKSPKYGYIVNRAGLRTRVKIYQLYKDIEKLIAILRSWDQDVFFEKPSVILNRHCPLCEFRKSCQKIAEKEDNLSLLVGIKNNEIKKLNKKGIFTVFQLSYTFRAKKNKSKLRAFPLQAQSIRDQKIYIYGEPLIPKSKTEIYFDIEGIPDQGFQYLIGVLVVDDQKHEYHHFWSDTKEDELVILKRFLALLAKYENFTLFHYGAYETAYLKRVAKKLDGQDLITLESALSSCSNILKIIYSSIYFPSHSNSLKSIANSIGFKWSEPAASGIQSIVWRMKWDLTGSRDLKEKLIQYNREDCIALLEVRKVIGSIVSSEKCTLMYEAISNSFASERLGLSFVRKNFALPEIELETFARESKAPLKMR